MKTHCKITLISLISLVVFTALTGCTQMMTSRMPTGSATMEQTYNEAISGKDRSVNTNTHSDVRHEVAALRDVTPDYSEYSRTEATEITNLFPELPNPSVVMYIYPHQAGTGLEATPVPGYSTVFPLYQHAEYAMPGDTRSN